MLSFTPYLGFLVVFVSVLGLWFPLLGFFLPVVFATLMLTGVLWGRWFCGNLCPRGSFNDFWLSKVSRKRRIPKVARSLLVRVPILALMMGFMFWRIAETDGIAEKVGMVFVSMCVITTSLAVFFGVMYSPRTWCSFCPMGTLQRFLGGSKRRIVFDKAGCISCGVCHKVCPMQLSVNKITHDPDCIKCGRCVGACPVGALRS